jgi:hypothetical protein
MYSKFMYSFFLFSKFHKVMIASKFLKVEIKTFLTIQLLILFPIFLFVFKKVEKFDSNYI